MDLSEFEFLLARIAEDEALARRAVDPERPGTHWHWVVAEDDTTPVADDDGTLTNATGEQWRVSLRSVEEFPTTSGVGDLPAFALSAEEVPSGVAAHIARHDPAFVLAECDAKRRIVEHHRPNGDDWPLCVICTEVGPDAQGWPCLTLRLLALPYADHPDFQQDWKV